MTEVFHEIPGNPVPEKAAGGYLRRLRRQEAALRAVRRQWRGRSRAPSSSCRAATSASRNISRPRRDLSARGFTTAMLDWRGQGGSDRLLRDRQRGHVRSFSRLCRDLDRFFEEVVLPDCRGPYYILAHSTGSLVALLATPSLVNRVRRMVLVAPFLTYTGFPLSMKAIRRVAGVLYWLGLGRMYGAWGPRPSRSPPFATNKLTTDIAATGETSLLGETYPAAGARRTDRRLDPRRLPGGRDRADPEFIARIKVPVLFIGAGADEVVSTRAIADYARRLRGGSMLTIDGARHEILQEADIFREQSWPPSTPSCPAAHGDLVESG